MGDYIKSVRYPVSGFECVVSKNRECKVTNARASKCEQLYVAIWESQL